VEENHSINKAIQKLNVSTKDSESKKKSVQKQSKKLGKQIKSIKKLE